MDVKRFFLNPENSTESIRFLKSIIERGVGFNLGKTILKENRPNQLIKLVKEKLPLEGTSLKEVTSYFENELLPYCVNQANPKYIAFPDAGNSLAGITADVFKPFLNQNLIADIKSAPIGTYLEIQVIDWFRQLVKYKTHNTYPKNISEVGGVVCFGGVLSNVISLLVARSKMLKDSFDEGLDRTDMYLLVPDIITHYSKNVAMGYLGLGANKVIPIKLDSNYRMDLDDLRSTIKRIHSKKGKILAVSAYAGDSRTMQIDNLTEISKICKKNDIWFHIDACHGSALLFSKKYRNKIKGIELADSITLDPHKVLAVPYPCSIVLFKKPQDLVLVSKDFDMTIQSGTYDLGQITPFIGSKSFESLKLWFIIKSLGIKKIGEIVDMRTELAEYFKDLVDNNDDFVALNEININSLTFLFYPKELRKLYSKNSKGICRLLDDINKEIHNEIYDKGDACIHTFKLEDIGDRAHLKNSGTRQVLGAIFGNTLTEKKHIKEVFDQIIETSKRIYKQKNLKEFF